MGNFWHLKFGKRGSNAEKGLIHATRLVTIILYPPDVPARTHVTRQCSGYLKSACGVTDALGEINLTSDPHRHNEKRRLPSPVVDVLAHAHIRYRAVRRDESAGTSRR